MTDEEKRIGKLSRTALDGGSDESIEHEAPIRHEHRGEVLVRKDELDEVVREIQSTPHPPLVMTDESICKTCGNEMEWVRCEWCDDGVINGEELMMEDPLWYTIDDVRTCSQCCGSSGHWQCLLCHTENEIAALAKGGA